MGIKVPSAPNNRNWIDFGGTYTGTTNKIFHIEIKGATNGTSGTEVWRWRARTVDNDGSLGDWTSWKDKDGDTISGSNNYGDNVVVNTSYDLADGMSVKFTRPSASTYTPGDAWKFMCYADLKLSEDTNLQFDYL